MNTQTPGMLGSSLSLLCGVTLMNRMVKTATSELLADVFNQATDKHATLYKIWAKSGCGLLITGNVQIDYQHLEHPGNVVIQGHQTAKQLLFLNKWSAAAKSHGSKVFMQLSHGGR